jgi:hypothetical protein
MLRALLFFNIFYTVNDIHFPWGTGIPGVAPANILFVVIVLLMRNEPDALPAEVTGILRRRLQWLIGMVFLAFLWGQVRSPGDFIEDATFFKNAIFYPLFYFLYLRCRQDEKTTRLLIIWVLAIAAVAGLEGFREGLDYGFGKYNPFRRASGPFGEDWRNANRAGVFYAMFMPMFVALALFLKKRKVWRIAAFVGCAVLAGGSLATYSRQSYVLILLSVALLLLRKSLIVAGLVGVLAVSLATYLPDSVTQRVDETQKTTSTGKEEVDTSTESRWIIWAGGMRMLADHPLGVGFRRFRTEIGDYTSYKGYDAHNFYVLTLAEQGPQGLIVLLLVVAGWFKLAGFLRRSADQDDPELKALTLGFTVCTINTTLGALYGSPTFEGAVMSPYWALAGLLERYVHLKMIAKGVKPADQAPPTLASRFPLAVYIRPGAPGSA